MKKEKILIVVCVILAVISVALGGFIIYDKIIKTDKPRKAAEEIEYKSSDYCDYRYGYKLFTVKVVNKDGAKVYGDTLKEVNTLKYGTEIEIDDDYVFYAGYDYNQKYNSFDEIKDHYYLKIFDCNTDYRYINYSDIEVIKESIVAHDLEKPVKLYATEDTKIYTGPDLMFESKDSKNIIPKGTIFTVKKGLAYWYLVETEKYNGWVLEYTSPADYPYTPLDLWGTARILTEEKSTLTLKEQAAMYEFPISTDSQLTKIPANTKLNYDYYLNDMGDIYYHVKYNSYYGWVHIKTYE